MTSIKEPGVTPARRPLAWPVTGLGLLLLALNQIASSDSIAIYVLAGACRVAGLIGVVTQD